MIRRSMMLIMLATAVSCGQRNDDSETNSKRSGTGEQSEQTQGHESTKTKDDWTVEFAKMASALELSGEETTNLKAAFQVREQAFSNWMSKNGAQLNQLERQMAEAAKARDLVGVRRIIAQAGPLRNELRNLLKMHGDTIRGTLTAENQVGWDAHALVERLLEMMESLDLTEEQIKEIHAKAVLVVQASANEPNPEAAGFLQLEKGVESSVLSVDQRQAYETVKKKHPFRSLK